MLSLSTDRARAGANYFKIVFGPGARALASGIPRFLGEYAAPGLAFMFCNAARA